MTTQINKLFAPSNVHIHIGRPARRSTTCRAFIAVFAMLVVALCFAHAGASEPAIKDVTHVGLWVVAQSEVAEYQGAALTHSGGRHWSLAFGTDGSLGTFSSIAFDRFNSAWVGFCDGNGAKGTIVGLSAKQMRRLAHHQPINAATILTEPFGGPNFLDCPIALAFDASGNLWAANSFSSDAPSIVGFTPQQLAQGATPPAYEYMAPEVFSPQGLVFDRAGNMWVSEPLGVFEFRADKLTGGGTLQSDLSLPSFTGALNEPYGAAFDSSGNLWVAYRMTGESDNAGAGGIAKYAAADLAGSGAIAPAPLVVLTSTQIGKRMSISSPDEIAFDPSGNLWVANPTNAQRGIVTGFKPNQLQASGSPIPALGIFSDKVIKSMPSPYSITIGPTLSDF